MIISTTNSTQTTAKLLNDDEKVVWFDFIQEKEGVAEYKDIPFTRHQVTSVLTSTRTYMFVIVNFWWVRCAFGM